MSAANREAIRFAKWPTAATIEGWIFGHYDSRGGAFLVTGAAHVVEAMEHYQRSLFWCEPGEPISADGWDSAHEDLIGKRKVIFLGDEIPEQGSELLASYRGEGGWEAFKLEEQFPDSRRWFEREDYLILVPVGKARADEDEDGERSERPRRVQASESWRIENTRMKYRLRPWDLGEDACGLCWLPAPDPAPVEAANPTPQAGG